MTIKTFLVALLSVALTCSASAQEYRTSTRKACAAYKHNTVKVNRASRSFLPTGTACIAWRGNKPRRRARRYARKLNRSNNS